jgi:branched-chain amino acid transport system ATP-binding protein
MEALKVNNLSKHFGGVHAVNKVSFCVEAGERVAIIGPNGAGKTTLFNLINGQLSATEGQTFFFGQDVTSLPTHVRANLGMARAFQIISLLQNLTVLDNALLTLHGTKPSRYSMLRPMKEFSEVTDKAAQALKTLELWNKRDDPVKNLSYGEQRRLEIWLGLAMEPKLLLLDEPSAGSTREEVSDIISIIKNLDSNITVLIVDHDMDMVFEAAERIIVLHFGEVITDGTPQKVKTNQKVKEIYMGIEENGDNAGA